MKIEIRIPENKSIEDFFLKEIEKKFSAKIFTENNNIEVECDDAYKLIRIREIINALIFGFEKEECKYLFNDDYHLEIVEIKNFLSNRNNRDRLKELKGRIIGKHGKAKKNIQELTNTKIVINRNMVGIIGAEDNVIIAKRAVEMLLEGRTHSTVYNFLVKEIRKRKLKI